MFPVLCDHIPNKPLIYTEFIFLDIQQHLKLVSGHFAKYYLKETCNNFDCILNNCVVAKNDL